MRKLIKTCNFTDKDGNEFTFDIGIDRNITCKTFEEFPDLVSLLMEMEVSNTSEKDFMLKVMREKKLEKVLSINEEITELVKFALPLMLKKAEENSNSIKAQEILEYVAENGVLAEFNNAMLEFISLGFTMGGQDKKPKVKFAMR